MWDIDRKSRGAEFYAKKYTDLFYEKTGIKIRNIVVEDFYDPTIHLLIDFPHKYNQYLLDTEEMLERQFRWEDTHYSLTFSHEGSLMYDTLIKKLNHEENGN